MDKFDKNVTLTSNGCLLPCSFCGGDAATDFIEGASYVIKCSTCSSRSTHLASASIAIAAWNRRAVMATSPVAVLAAADYAAIIKRYDDAGDTQNAHIIRKQWEVAQAAEGVEIACSSCGLTTVESHTLHDIKRGVAALAQVQVDTQTAGAAQNCRSSEKVQAVARASGASLVAESPLDGATPAELPSQRKAIDALAALASTNNAFGAMLAAIKQAQAAEAVSIMLWLYRRLPRGYGRPLHIERVVECLALHADIDVSECFAERGPDPRPNEKDQA